MTSRGNIIHETTSWVDFPNDCTAGYKAEESLTSFILGFHITLQKWVTCAKSEFSNILHSVRREEVWCDPALYKSKINTVFLKFYNRLMIFRRRGVRFYIRWYCASHRRDTDTAV